MFRTTLKNLAAHKLRLLTTGIAVVLGVAFMTGSLVLTDTIGRTFDNLLADVNAGVNAYVRSDESIGDGGTAPRGRIAVTVVEEVAAIDGVDAAEPSVQGYAQILDEDGQPLGTSEMGPPSFGANWITTDSLNPFELSDGRAPSGRSEVVIDRGSAKLGDLQLGDRATVLSQAGSTAVTVVGIASFGDADSPAGASYALFDLDTAQELVAEPGRIDGVRVAAAPGVSEDDLATRIAAAVQGDLEVLTGAELTAEDQDAVAAGLGFFSTFLLTFALVALFVGSFLIYNTFTILVAQRGRETALLRAIGASRRQVLASVLGEAVAVGVVASVVGVIAGIGVAGMLKGLLAAMGIDIPADGLVVARDTVVVSMVTGVVVSVASGVLPARRAARTAPIAAMQALQTETGGGRRRLATGAGTGTIGAAAMAAGLFGGAGVAAVGLGAALVFVAVATLGPALARPITAALGAPLRRVAGLPGALGRENAMRNPRRTSATASALMIGVGLVGTITVLASSAKASVDATIEASFSGDVVVDTGAMGGATLSPALAEEIAALSEVETVTSLRTTTVEIDGDATQLVGAAANVVSDMFDLGSTEGSIADLDARHIAVSSSQADDAGLAVGDELRVRFADTGIQILQIGAVYTDDTVAGPYLVDLTAFEANVADQLDAKVFATIADGVSLDAAKAAIEEAAAVYPQAVVQDREEFAAAAGEHIDQMLNLVYALLLLAIVIALIGIANTLVLSVVERTRELGLLRAVGMSRRQLKATVRWESVLVALLGTILGLAVGTAFGWALVQALSAQGIDVFVVPAGQLLFIAALAALAGVVAAILPARRAARLDVLRAIATT